RLARQDADRPADLLVATDDGIELAAARQRDEVAAVLLERLVRRLRVGRRHALRAADVLQRLHHELARDAALEERAAGRRLLPLLGESEEQVLGGHVLVLEALRLL